MKRTKTNLKKQRKTQKKTIGNEEIIRDMKKNKKKQELKKIILKTIDKIN